MGYQFSNNWPYNYTVFPTMVDHTDPVNNTYFSGLHTEIENIEDELGLDPAGDYSTVKNRLDALGIAGKFKIKQIEVKHLATDVGTTSATYATPGNQSITITTGACKLLILFSGNIQITQTNGLADLEAIVSLKVGGSYVAGTRIHRIVTAGTVGTLTQALAINRLESLAAGEHTIAIWWKRVSATTQMVCSANSSPAYYHMTLIAVELYEET